MENLEESFHQSSENSLILQIVYRLTGVYYSNEKREDLERPKEILVDQHNKVKPQCKAYELYNLVAKNDPIINHTKSHYYEAVAENNNGTAMETLNELFAYAETDFNDSLGGKALASSLDAHRDFSRKISLDDNPYLGPEKDELLDRLAVFNEQNNYFEELTVLRRIIHLAALDGALGEKAKEQFDPFAILDRSILEN